MKTHVNTAHILTCKLFMICRKLIKMLKLSFNFF